jgi:dihydroneopterin aldolase
MLTGRCWPMTIHIRDLAFDAIIGILEHERTKAQRVVINCTIRYTYAGAFLNYAEVAGHIRSEMIAGKFALVEEALLSLKSTLKTKFGLIETLELEISKPDILPDCRVSVSESFDF